jgi:hypothetical protein
MGLCIWPFLAPVAGFLKIKIALAKAGELGLF